MAKYIEISHGERSLNRGMPTSLQDLGIPNQSEAKEQILSYLFKNNMVEDSEEAKERLRQGILRICQ